MSLKEKVVEVYRERYKKLLVIPFIVLLLAFLQLGWQYGMTGDFVNKGISLKGGSTITISKEIDALELENYLLGKFAGAEIAVRKLTAMGKQVGVAVDSDAEEREEIEALVGAIKEKVELKEGDYGVEVMGATLGRAFFKQVITAILIAFVLMAIVVFAYFRVIVPCGMIVLAIFSDIVITLAIFNLTGIKLSTAGIAALLMLIGYSVDTDILLSTRVLKRKEGSVLERVFSAMKTGLMMSGTTMAAIIVALVVAQSAVIKQIMVILLIGLITDLLMTWLQNAGLLRWYLEKKHKVEERLF